MSQQVLISDNRCSHFFPSVFNHLHTGSPAIQYPMERVRTTSIRLGSFPHSSDRESKLLLPREPPIESTCAISFFKAFGSLQIFSVFSPYL